MSMIGKTLGHYKIGDQPLGRGGMGEVYRAKDLKLGRDVAIKVLPEEFARDTDRVSRFQREAKLLASLNHPNIAAIYGLEEFGGIQFLVLELVEGETLADQLKRGPIPVEESLKLALQIAEALEAAHEKGVIHRDLKPANLKCTPEGKVKVLDFGLAKAFAGDQADLNLSNSPTLSNAATQQGVILGTAAYMSPEQASGKRVDKRADVWAFGVVLYEMLAGRSLFAGENVSQTLARVLERQPDFSILPPNLHPKIIEMLQRCLVKEAKNRCHDIADVRIDIQRVLSDPNGVFVHPIAAVEPRRKLKTILPWAAATLVLGLIIAGVADWNLRKPEPRQVSRFYYELPNNQQFSLAGNRVLAISPDGTQFAYSTPGGLYLQKIGELDAKRIVGTEDNPMDPFFSPDGRWIGYWSQLDQNLKKIAISGGAPVTLCKVTFYAGAKWFLDGTIAYGTLFNGTQRISANGGNPEPILQAKPKELTPEQLLPDGKSVLISTSTGGGPQIAVQSLETGKRIVLFQGDTARYLPTGYLVYLFENQISAVQFDIEKLEVRGIPVPMIQGVKQFSLSDSGTLVYIPLTSKQPVPGAANVGIGVRNLVWVDRAGKEQAVNAPPNGYFQPRISPDGRYVALSIAPGNNQPSIWIWDLVREAATRLTLDQENNNSPLWTFDNKHIIFSSSREGKQGIYCISADGTGEAKNLGSATDRIIGPICLSADGKSLVLMSIYQGNNFDIGIMPIEGDRIPKTLVKGVQPRVSPDGRWIAYTSPESGQMEVYVRSFPETDRARWQVSTKGGHSPLWSPDGRELFYRNGDAVMTTSVENEPTFKLGNPRILFSGAYIGTGLVEGTPWDVHPDGKRFLMLKPAMSTATTSGQDPGKIIVALNWIEELKQKVSVK